MLVYTAVIESANAGGAFSSVSVPLLIAILGQLLAVIFVFHLLERGSSPSATLSWILFILAAPYVGLLAYYVMPRRMQRMRLRKRRNRLSWIAPSLEQVASIPALGHEAKEPLARLLASMDPDSVCAGNRLTLIEDGPGFLAKAEQEMARAEKFVHFQTYILRPDASGLRFLEMLTSTAARGVEVRLLYDSIGSWWLKPSHLAAFHEAGGQSAPFMPLLWRRRPFNLNLRNHRKQLFVDGRIGFVGGRNVGDEYMLDRFGTKHRWLDTMVAVEGPAVARMHRSFVEDWLSASEEDLANKRYFPLTAAMGREVVGVVASGPDTTHSTFHWLLFQMLGQARHKVDLSSPYLVPHPSIVTALQVAATRGVQVRIFTNGRKVSAPILYRAQRSYYRGMLAAGVAIAETVDDFNHTKSVVVDEKHAFVGSPNVDVRSVDLNFEIGVVALDSALADDVSRSFERRLSSAHWLTMDDLEDGRLERVGQGICRLLSPLL